MFLMEITITKQSLHENSGKQSITLNTEMTAIEFRNKLAEIGLGIDIKKSGIFNKTWSVKIYDYGSYYYYTDKPNYTYYFDRDHHEAKMKLITELVHVDKGCKGFWNPKCKYSTVEKTVWMR